MARRRGLTIVMWGALERDLDKVEVGRLASTQSEHLDLGRMINSRQEDVAI